MSMHSNSHAGPDDDGERRDPDGAVNLAAPTVVASVDSIPIGQPFGATVDGVELVVVRTDASDDPRVFAGRCRHRGALIADGRIDGDDLICGVHGWDYRIDTGISSYDNSQCLHRFRSDVVQGNLRVDLTEVGRYRRREALVVVADDDPHAEWEYHYSTPHAPPEEPFVGDIHELARHGLSRVGKHGPTSAMGVPRTMLPSWDDLQFVTAQLARFPLLDDEAVETSVEIGPAAARPLRLELPIFVSDMSFGALSAEAKTALARGAERAGTGICSGEGGMLPEEQAENSRYFYELASAGFGWDEAHLDIVQAFHLKFGQGAKTGTGGHLPGSKVHGRIAEVRGLPEGTAAISPARFPQWSSLTEIAEFVAHVRERSGGIPIGVKMSAQNVEADLDAALSLGLDYIILDGRGGGTGAAPRVLRDHISVPTMPALARARRHLDAAGATSVTLVATGGFRTAPDIAKALALGADAVAVSNAALQAIGCVGMRACHTDRCPVGIATQDPALRARLPVDEAANRLARFFEATRDLLVVLARACGHRSLQDFDQTDLTSFDERTASLAGVRFAGAANHEEKLP